MLSKWQIGLRGDSAGGGSIGGASRNVAAELRFDPTDGPEGAHGKQWRELRPWLKRQTNTQIRGDCRKSEHLEGVWFELRMRSIWNRMTGRILRCVGQAAFPRKGEAALARSAHFSAG